MSARPARISLKQDVVNDACKLQFNYSCYSYSCYSYHCFSYICMHAYTHTGIRMKQTRLWSHPAEGCMVEAEKEIESVERREVEPEIRWKRGAEETGMGHGRDQIQRSSCRQRSTNWEELVRKGATVKELGSARLGFLFHIQILENLILCNKTFSDRKKQQPYFVPWSMPPSRNSLQMLSEGLFYLSCPFPKHREASKAAFPNF